MSRIGIMGGTFNPIHQGHIMLAQKSHEQFQLDKILVIPNKLPTYKDTDELLDSDYRSKMVQLAIRDFPYMEFSDMELRRTGATYTVDTLETLKKSCPEDEFFFILGGDSLVHLHEWRSYQKILTLSAILCAKREDADLPDLYAARESLLVQVPEARIYFLETPMVNISSTEIREHLYSDCSIAQWLPNTVYDFIIQNHLYIS